MKICSRPECSKEFEAQDKRQKFCSRSCAATFNNAKYIKRKRDSTYCLVCEKKLNANQSRFCSRDHAFLFKRETKIQAWLNGDDDGSMVNCGHLSATIRRFLLDEAGWACSLCGWSVPNPVTKKPILAIDHIDGNWRNNRRDNLIVLCYNCHTLTPTFNSLNAGNGAGFRGSAKQYLTIS